VKAELRRSRFCHVGHHDGAMMLPSAAPAILKAVSLAHKRPEGVGGIPTALFFAAGYLMVWTGFSFAATLLQWALDSAHLLSETIAIRSRVVAGVLVILVGLYQLTPLKQTFLRRCRLSVRCLAEDQHQSARAIVRQGMQHGVSCLGCCSGLMALLRRRFDEYPLDGGSRALGAC
jgi:predicted metal-binding membrane protein